MHVPQCAICKWPLILSATNCSICGNPIIEGSSHHHGAPHASNVTAKLVPLPLLDRSFVHGIVVGLLFISWMIVPRVLFRVEWALIGGYWLAVSIFSYSTSTRILKDKHADWLLFESNVFGVLSLFFFLSFMWGSSMQTNQALAQVPEGRSTLEEAQRQRLSTEDPEQRRIRERGERTAEYLKECEHVSASHSLENLPNEELLRKIDQLIDAIEGIPTNGVDTDAVEYIFAMTKYFRMAQQYSRRSNDPSIFVESFVRGALGDPLGVANEIEQSRLVVVQEWERLQGSERHLNAVLSARYNRAFP